MTDLKFKPNSDLTVASILTIVQCICMCVRTYEGSRQKHGQSLVNFCIYIILNDCTWPHGSICTTNSILTTQLNTKQIDYWKSSQNTLCRISVFLAYRATYIRTCIACYSVVTVLEWKYPHTGHTFR